ncbi:MAG: UDP-N-acetylmuramate:L-alanyl-gamma-D-glutamyl-meso-diaminopimelate ligase [Deltaproteobacteria bacterium]|nr:UDP-N-acetylmuramate:L-alanyl-gamma-D-glutamyl-meso-diaminopimelate ligase [Deltaproteobacteria bacterium]
MNDKKINQGHSAELSKSLNMAPRNPRHIHLMGICGTGMASLAGILRKKGYDISGSDENIYPPMSLFLKDMEIPVLKGYKPENLYPVPDLVIVGNVITKYNPEAIELSRLNIPYLSMPQALKEYAMHGKKAIVIAGTHGKTTTSSLVSWLMEEAGRDPGFMIGGMPHNFNSGFRLGDGPYFIIEGDEYDTAFFDKGAKFLHYDPWITILTSIEFDHADIFNDLEQVVNAFRRLIDIIPHDGLLIANGDDPLVLAESKRAKCPVITYGLTARNHWKATPHAFRDGCTHLEITRDGESYMDLRTTLYGKYNISNLLSAIALSDFLGLSKSDIHKASEGFKGVKRRQEIKGIKAGITVIDDFAHHPTAVNKTITAVKERYGNHRLLAVFEPRSNSSRRRVFQDQYAESFDMADMVFIPDPVMLERIPADERFSSKKLVDALISRGKKAVYSPDTNHLLEEILERLRTGDVVLIMSNGSFDNIHERLLERLETFS